MQCAIVKNEDLSKKEASGQIRSLGLKNTFN